MNQGPKTDKKIVGPIVGLAVFLAILLFGFIFSLQRVSAQENVWYFYPPSPHSIQGPYESRLACENIETFFFQENNIDLGEFQDCYRGNVQISLLSETNKTDSSVTLRFSITNGSGVSFEVRYGTDSESLINATLPEPLGDEREFTITGLSPNTDYYYDVVEAQTEWPYRSGTFKTLDLEFDIIVEGEPGTTISVTSQYELLAPLPEIGGMVDIDKGLGDYLNALFRFIIGLAGVLAVVMIVFGGIQYMMTDVVFDKEDAKKKITGAIWGLILALGSFVILNTINPDLLNLNIGIKPVQLSVLSDEELFSLVEDVIKDVPQTAIDGKFCTRTAGGPYDQGANWTEVTPQPSESANRQKLTSKVGDGGYNTGVETSGGGTTTCVAVGQSNCTSVRGLNLSYISKLRQGCPNCDLVITGGTECWLHGGTNQLTSHRPDSPTIDLRVTDSLNKYILGETYTLPTTNKRVHKSGWPKITIGGEEVGVFYYEITHWHVGY